MEKYDILKELRCIKKKGHLICANLIINNGTTFWTYSWSFITREASSNDIHNVRNLSENTIMFPVNRLFCIVARQEAGGGQWRVEWTEFEMYEYFVRLKHVRLTLYLFSLLDLDNPVPARAASLPIRC